MAKNKKTFNLINRNYLNIERNIYKITNIIEKRRVNIFTLDTEHRNQSSSNV